MDSETQIILAFLFKRSGKTILSESEIYLTLSLELGWFTTQEAKTFVKHAIEHKILQQKKEKLTPNFDIEKTTIPVHFRPSTRSYKKQDEKPIVNTQNVVETLIQHITETTKQNQNEVIKQIKQITTKKHILPEIAALYIAHINKIDTKDIFHQVEKQIFTENEE